MSEQKSGERQRRTYTVREGGTHVVESPKAGRERGAGKNVKDGPVEAVEVKEGDQ